MHRINIFITKASGNLVVREAQIIKSVRIAENYAFPKLKITWDIDLLVTDRLKGIVIPEDGVGGRSITSDFIEFAIDEEKATENLISEMVVHELCHAARWGKNNEWANSLFDCMISEGIATCLEAEFVKDRKTKTVFITTILEREDDENEKILKRLTQNITSL